MANNFFNDTRGLTLIELMIVMALSVLLMGAAFLAHQVQSKSGRAQDQIAIMQQDLRAVMDIVEKDVRNSGCNPAGASLSAFVAASSGASSFGVKADLDGDGAFTKENEDVSYQLNGTALERTDVVNGTEILSNNITVFSVRYYDENATLITPSPTLTSAQADSVLYVQIRVTAQTEDVDPDSGSRLTRTLTREISSRNRQIQFDS